MSDWAFSVLFSAAVVGLGLLGTWLYDRHQARKPPERRKAEERAREQWEWRHGR